MLSGGWRGDLWRVCVCRLGTSLIIWFCVHKALLGRQLEALFIIGLDFYFLYRNLRGSGKEHLTLCKHRTQWRFETLSCGPGLCERRFRLPVLEEGVQPGFQNFRHPPDALQWGSRQEASAASVGSPCVQVPLQPVQPGFQDCGKAAAPLSVPRDQSCHHVLSLSAQFPNFPGSEKTPWDKPPGVEWGRHSAALWWPSGQWGPPGNGGPHPGRGPYHNRGGRQGGREWLGG